MTNKNTNYYKYPTYFKKYREKNKKKISQMATEWQAQNKEQHNKHVAKYAKKNPDVAKLASKRYRERNKGNILFLQREMLNRARNRAKKFSYPFDITIEDIQQKWPSDNRCPILGIEFDLLGVDKTRCASLDKVVPEKGYTKNNIIIISHRANSLKRDGTVQELRLLVEFLEKLT